MPEEVIPMKVPVVVAVLMLLLAGCGGGTGNPVATEMPADESPNVRITTQQDGYHYSWEPYHLWGEWTFHINADEESVDIVPRRAGRQHLNAHKFLEDGCGDCLEITEISNNGDSTIDVTVQIKHPFGEYPEYTGFDVKGIMMFTGSYLYPFPSDEVPLPSPYIRISWRETGDPEVLNADGYTPRWSPQWDSGSDLPIYNYCEGKYTEGVPDADLNAYLDFYSIEERHIFEHDATVSRTYTIYMPSSEITVGYAVEACWDEPMVTPVTDPVNDFPPTANQPEAYYVRYVLNMGEVITDCETCCGAIFDETVCEQLHIEVKQWGGLTSDRLAIWWPPDYYNGLVLNDFCDVEDWYYTASMDSCKYGNGTHRHVCYNHRYYQGVYYDIAYVIFDFVVNDPEL